MSPATAHEPSGSWDSIHVFETLERGRQAHYKLTSTVMLQLINRHGTEADSKAPADKKGPEGWKRDGEVSLSGSMTRQVRVLVSFEHLPHGNNISIDLAIERAGLAVAGQRIAHHKHRKDD